MEEDIDFSEWLQKQIDDRGWNRAELARRSGISAPQITRILNREQEPGKESLNALARALNLSPEFLFLKATSSHPIPLDQATLDELKNILSQLPPEKYAEFLEHGWVMVRNARKVQDK